MVRLPARFAWILVAGPGIALALVWGVGMRTPEGSAYAQEGEGAPDPELLMRDIHFLDLFRNLSLTGEQRKQAAEATAGFQARHEAIMKLAHPDELVTALEAVRETLLRGEEATAEMREAVEVARPPDDGSIDQEFVKARTELIEKLEATLTDDQKGELMMLPLVEVARDMVFMSMETREAPAAEREEMRRNAFPEIREQLAAAAGADASIVLADFQARIDHLLELSPQQLEQQQETLVQQNALAMTNVLRRSPEMASERLADQLFEWAVEPGIGELLAESAQAMGAQ